MKKLLTILLIILSVFVIGCGKTAGEAGADGSNGSTGTPGQPGDPGQSPLYPIMREYTITTANQNVYYQTLTAYSNDNIHIQEFRYGDAALGENYIIVNIPHQLCGITGTVIVKINDTNCNIDLSTLSAIASGSKIVWINVARSGVDSAQQKFLPDALPIDPANPDSFTGIYYNGTWYDLAWTAQYFIQSGIEI